MSIYIFLVVSLFAQVAVSTVDVIEKIEKIVTDHKRVNGECSSQDDCATGECCVIGMQRYSTAYCKQKGKIGDACLMDNDPEDLILSYPNKEVEAHGLYRLMCPCATFLHCVNATCT